MSPLSLDDGEVLEDGLKAVGTGELPVISTGHKVVFDGEGAEDTHAFEHMANAESDYLGGVESCDVSGVESDLPCLRPYQWKCSGPSFLKTNVIGSPTSGSLWDNIVHCCLLCFLARGKTPKKGISKDGHLKLR